MINPLVAQMLQKHQTEQWARTHCSFIIEPLSIEMRCLLCDTPLHYTIHPGWKTFLRMRLPAHPGDQQQKVPCPMTFEVTYWRRGSTRTLQQWPICKSIRGWWNDGISPDPLDGQY
jgi:hypothetical protein